MSDCGGSCGGGASGGDGASSSPGDSVSSAKDAKKPHACKCVCVCGTKTGVEPTEVLRSYEFPVEPRAIQPGTGGPPEPAPGFARETVAWSGWDPSPGRSLEPPRPPEFGGVPPDPPPGRPLVARPAFAVRIGVAPRGVRTPRQAPSTRPTGQNAGPG